MSQREFGGHVGVSHSLISKVEGGSEKPSQDLIDKLVDTYGVDREWIEKGKGDLKIDIDIFLSWDVGRRLGEDAGNYLLLQSSKARLYDQLVDLIGIDTGIKFRKVRLTSNGGREPLPDNPRASKFILPLIDKSPDLIKMIRGIQELWVRSNDKEKAWMYIQFERAFPQLAEKEGEPEAPSVSTPE